MILTLAPASVGWNLSRSADHGGHATAVWSWSEVKKEIHTGRSLSHTFFQP